MTFGYNAAYTGDATSGRIRDFGKQLLEALKIEREEVKEQRRSHFHTNRHVVPEPTVAIRLP